MPSTWPQAKWFLELGFNFHYYISGILFFKLPNDHKIRYTVYLFLQFELKVLCILILNLIHFLSKVIFCCSLIKSCELCTASSFILLFYTSFAGQVSTKTCFVLLLTHPNETSFQTMHSFVNQDELVQNWTLQQTRNQNNASYLMSRVCFIYNKIRDNERICILRIY